ncbi:AraC family transcriptional regulator [Caulobacter sp.]|uniref:AraC family transcriptional regulator n=1 Tax=Caulobacter sp. TaxID=78 RepID=UPI002B483B76|nr:AraC family transcriptional regulator [Caulobacter sp.]HJV40880.1 AraC family transcriptional regulator [Caulobacter sp.]
MRTVTLIDHPAWPATGGDQVRALIDDALKLLDRDRHAARTYLSQAHRIIDRELELAPGLPEPASSRAKGARLTGWRVSRLAEFIEANIERTIKVGELASVIRISTSQLGRCFNVTFGLTPSGFVMRQRLERARRMMLTSDDSLAQIAYACGLCDQAHLTRAFRKHYGYSPAAWRRDHRAKDRLAAQSWSTAPGVLS